MLTNIPNLANYLRNSGYKLTAQRQIVLNIIAEHRTKHLSVEEINEMLQSRYPGIGLSTIYRTLPILERMRLVQKINLDDGCMRYQFTSPDEKHEHHHLICLECGEVIDMEVDLLDNLEKQIMHKNGFTVTDHKVKFFGTCHNCKSHKEMMDIKEGYYD